MGSARFSRRVRLLNKTDFDRVFEQAGRSGDHCFTVLYRPNGQAYARLGLAVSRKSARSAVVRNRIKRIVRESFRLNQPALPPLDIVVITRPNIARQDTTTLHNSIQRHWCRLLP